MDTRHRWEHAWSQLCDDAVDKTDDTWEKIVLMLLATFGMIAPAATATKPAIRAYSMRSCPRVSFQIRSLNKNRFRFFTTTPLLNNYGRRRRLWRSVIYLKCVGISPYYSN